jgi:hypothetical protein
MPNVTRRRRRELREAADGGESLAEVTRRFRSSWHPDLIVTLDEHGLPVVAGKGPDVTSCALFQDKWPSCTLPAGCGTLHPGTGPCRRHGGNSRRERTTGALMTAHAIARVLDVDPWEVLEVAMRRAYGWAAWYQGMIATAESDDDLRPGGSHYDWVKAAERTTEQAIRYAKMALDAGVAERQVQQVELQGQLIAQVLSATLHELGMDDATEIQARVIMEKTLRQLSESGRADVIAGELLE